MAMRAVVRQERYLKLRESQEVRGRLHATVPARFIGLGKGVGGQLVGGSDGNRD